MDKAHKELFIKEEDEAVAKKPRKHKQQVSTPTMLDYTTYG